MAEIKWEAPPASRGGPGGRKHAEFFDALRARPGEWALFSEDSSAGVASQIQNGRYGGSEPGEFEATIRFVPGTRRGPVWVRYVGGAA